MDNVWNWILDAVIWLIQQSVTISFGSVPDYYAAMNFAGVVSTGAWTVFELVYVTFSVFNLTFVGLYFGMLLSVTVVKIAVSIWLFIKGLIPVVG